MAHPRRLGSASPALAASQRRLVAVGLTAPRWPLGTKERLAVELLYTGQRSGDVRQMGRQHVRDGSVSVRQEKTGERLQVPPHPHLQASIAAATLGQLLFVETQHGKPYSSKGFGNWISDAATKAGLPHCSAHGLRKAAARRLAEAGASASEIAAVTGHRTLKEVERYVRAANQKLLAENAMARVTGAHGEQVLANPDERLANPGRKSQ